MQLRLQHKDHFNEDLLKRMNCINLFTKNLRKNALRRKSIHHVQFDETYSINSNNQNSSSLKRLLSGETGNICNQSVPLLSINNTNPVNINNNNNAHNIINTTESRITLNGKLLNIKFFTYFINEDLKPKRITKKKLVNIVCGDMVYEDTQKIKLFDGKFFSAYIYMDENINNDDKKNEKKVGKSIRSYVDDKENNTVFIDKYSSNNIEYKKTHISQGSSKSLLIKNKLKEINNRSLSEIPMNVLHSSSKSNLSQSSKLNLLLLKGRNFNESKKLNNKKLISNTSINFNVSNFNTNINVNNNTKDNQNKESLNNKELMMNQSQDKSNLNEIDNKINHSVFLKTIMKTNSLKRSSTPIIIRDEIFENENKEKSINKSIIKMNSCYGLSFKNKSLNSKNFDFLKKDDLYYSKKFYD